MEKVFKSASRVYLVIELQNAKKKNPGFITYLLDKERSCPGTVHIL
jgi:hypothetical protein